MTIALSLNHSAAFCRRMSPTFKSTAGEYFRAKFGEEGLTDVSQILTRSGKDMELSYTNEIVSISSAV